MTRHAVIGTAGHVDHGKTSLVKALTGVDCDRLPEEKRRGITIELGYAQWPVAEGLTASIVDVPGHERFVQTMVAGASGIDLALLVIAADDGVMPQTREHLAIAELLGVQGGVVAITKADLVDADMLALVVDEARELVARGPLASAEIIACSSRDGRGLGELASAVARAIGEVAPPATDGPPVLAIDRVFSKPGFGTVATGTLVRGTVQKGQALEVVSGDGDRGVEARARGLFVHDREVERATAPTRLALNLKGDGEALLGRGALVTRPGWLRPTRAIDVDLALLPSVRPVTGRSRLVLHLGTAHVSVRAKVLSGEKLAPGGRDIVRLIADAPFAAFAGQRFVVRRPELAMDRTLGGGAVLDPHPRLGRRGKERRETLARLAASPLADRVRAIVEESPDGIDPAALGARLAPEEQAGASAAVAKLTSAGALVLAGTGETKRLHARKHLEEAKRAFEKALRAFHEDHPALAGAQAGELVGRMPPHVRALASAAEEELARVGVIVVVSGRARFPDHDARHLGDRIVTAYAERGLTPENDDIVRKSVGLGERAFKDAVAELCRAGTLVRLGDGMHVHVTALDSVPDRVRAHFAKHETLSPVELKALFGLTRKHAMPLLEWLDASGLTRRKGDVRVLARAPATR